MYRDIVKGLDSAMSGMALLLLLMIPLAAWKLVDIIIWLFKNIYINVGLN